MQKAKRGAWLVAALMSLTVAAGCGGSGAGSGLTAASTDSLATSASFASAPATMAHGLGALIDGTPTVAYDEGSLQTQASLPELVDLRPQMSPVANQGILGSCTGFAIVKGLREFMLIKEGRPFTPLSAGFLWYQERKLAGVQNFNKGASIASGMKILDTQGTDQETDFPYPSLDDMRQFWLAHKTEPDAIMPWVAVRPSTTAENNAKKFRVGGIQQVNSLHAIRKSLASGMPVVMGIAIYESFDKVGHDGMVPVPNPDVEKLEGGHAITVSGYDNQRQLLIVKNSWGADWGDQGYFYLPYAFVKLGLSHDAWTAKLN